MTALRILLTGTGTIGRELLVPLLRASSNRVAVLMRDRRRRSAQQRADALFRELDLTASERARVEVLQGDVTCAGLGLDAAAQVRIIEDVDLIIHTAAATALTAQGGRMPVKETMIAGNLFEILNAIIAVENRSDVVDGRIRAPHILVDGVSVTGEE